jgi:hypothetical protein
MRGDGAVVHFGESEGVKFELRRVTDSLIAKHGLSFGVRALSVNENDEEGALVKAILGRKSSEERVVAVRQ